MSNMAAEMAARIAEDGGEGLVPGTDEHGQPEHEAPPAGAQNTDTPLPSEPTDTVPYARFKEVNDRYNQLRGYEELAGYGYDPDSLGRLAAFEAAYVNDPTGTVRRLMDDLDLPPELISAFDEHLGAQTGAAGAPSLGSGEGAGNQSTQQTAARDPEVQEALDYIRQRREADEDQANSEMLDRVVGHWRMKDQEDGIDIPEDKQLAYDQLMLASIQSTAARGGFTTVEELAEMARRPVIDYREAALGSAISPGSRRTGSPRAVPGSGPSGAAPQRFADLREASKAAEADIAAGRLPDMRGA